MEGVVSDLNETALRQYLQATLPDWPPISAISKFPNGQSNPTYRLTAGDSCLVLRRKPFGTLLKSAHAVDREFRLISALEQSTVPVAKAIHLCEDESIIGAMFYLMSFVPGRIFWNPGLPGLSNQARHDHYQAVVKTLASIHQVDLERHQLQNYGRPGNYCARQVERWRTQYRATEIETIPEMDQLIAWLEQHIPEASGPTTLIHGDFRLDNLIFAPHAPAVAAVLDWELSTLGDPIADLAYFCMCLRLPADGIIPGLAEVDRSALGIPQEIEIIRYYQSLTGWGELDDWPFYLAFCFFRLASIVQGVRKRALEGNASSDEALRVGEMVVPLAAQALEVIAHGAL